MLAKFLLVEIDERAAVPALSCRISSKTCAVPGKFSFRLTPKSELMRSSSSSSEIARARSSFCDKLVESLAREAPSN